MIAGRIELIMKTKLCRKCDEEKLLEEFAKSKTTKDGRYSMCKKCKNAYKKKHKARDPERYLAMAAGYKKRYQALYPERVKAQQIKAEKKRRARDARDPEKIKARQKREAKRMDRILNPEKYEALERKKANAYRTKNRVKFNAQRRDRYTNDSEFRAKELGRDKRRKPQHHEAYIKRRDTRSPEEIREEARASKAYQAKNREKRNAQVRARRSRDPGRYRAWGRKAYQKRKAEQTGFMLLKAMDIIKDELVKGDHEEKLERARAKENARLAEKREVNKAYYAKNREKILAKAKAEYAKDPGKYRAYRKKLLTKGVNHD